MDGREYGAATPPEAPGRYIDVELGGQEIVTINLDELDEDPADYIDLLKEGNAKVGIWTRLAGEYWKKGLVGAAERCAECAAEVFKSIHSEASLPPVYQLLANIQLARARKAPKFILETARQDDMRKEKVKDIYFQAAARQLNLGEASTQTSGTDRYVVGALLTRGIYNLAHGDFDDASRAFDAVLDDKPTNVVSLIGKARIAYARKQYTQALRLFQRVLQLSSRTHPDPRIGIGLCFWNLNQKAKARACWERSFELNPSNWAANLLLGIEAINASKNPDEDEDVRTESLIRGTKYCERAFNANNRNAAAANALFDFFMRRGDHKRSLKLAERTIQFAETKTLLGLGYIHAGHLAQINNLHTEAAHYFQTVLKVEPKNALAAIGLAQTQMLNDQIPAAIHTLDSLMQPPNPQRNLESSVLLASLRAYPRPGVSSTDWEMEQQKARELFEPVLKALNLNGADASRLNGSTVATALTSDSRSNRSPTRFPASGAATAAARTEEENMWRKAQANFGEDVELLVEFARLWQEENRERAVRILERAVSIVDTSTMNASANGASDDGAGAEREREPRLLNNVAVMKHMEGDLAQARRMYENALTEATAVERDRGTGEAMATTILYNLARCYEDQGEIVNAREAYDKLLSRHPEYADARVRQAQIAISQSRYDEAHELLKAAVASQKSNLNIRASLAHFLAGRQQLKLARDIVTHTLSSMDKNDVYSLCVLAWCQFTQARETHRDVSLQATQAAREERRKLFVRSAELYERALQIDSRCAVAAQGLAIITAEDVLGGPVGTAAGGAGGGGGGGGAHVDDLARRVQNTREALDIFSKVRESMNDSSVYVNIGHCHFMRDEFDRAIESYETAAKRNVSGPDVIVLQNLCRAWYAKANKDQSFASLERARGFAQRVLHVAPQEKSNAYNLAMIEQKAAEMLFGLPAAKRSLVDLSRAVQQGKHSIELFKSLATDESQSTPYSKDIAEQRKKYGESLMRRADEHLGEQRAYEQAQETRLVEARARRLEEKAKVEAAVRAKEEAAREKAVRLAEERRRMREEAQMITASIMVSDEEKEKKARGGRGAKKVKSEVVSGDDEAVSGSQGQVKKKRKRVKVEEGSGGDEEALFSAEEDGMAKLQKKTQKKRVVRDDDDEEAVSAAPRKKQYKSKEMISDSDEDMS